MQSSHQTKIGTWQLKKLALIHLAVLAGALWLVFYGWPENYLDRQAALFFNSVFCKYHFTKVAWALLNHRGADWVGDVVMFTLFVMYVLKMDRRDRTQGVAQLLMTAMCLVFLSIVVNTYLFRHPFKTYRNSPTLAIEHVSRVSEEVTWLKVKDHSKHSFPGDHATTAITFALFFSFLAPRSLGRWGIVYGVVMAMPRMVLGAHWLSDVLIGSGSIALITFAWVMYTPFHARFVYYFCKLIETSQRLVLPRQG